MMATPGDSESAPKVGFIGFGTMIYPMCNVDKEVRLGRGVLLNNTVTVSHTHNCTIGDGCYLSPGVTVSGNIDIGSECFVGAGAALANDIRIADRTTIGIGTTVTRDIESPGRSVISNPMRVLDHPLSMEPAALFSAFGRRSGTWLYQLDKRPVNAAITCSCCI